jgi:hypothetical protein
MKSRLTASDGRDEARKAWRPHKETYCREEAKDGAIVPKGEVVVFPLTESSLRIPPESGYNFSLWASPSLP